MIPPGTFSVVRAYVRTHAANASMANIARTRTSASGKEVTDLPTRLSAPPVLQRPLGRDNCRWYYQ